MKKGFLILAVTATLMACAGEKQQLPVVHPGEKGSPPTVETITFPNGTVFGGASKDQASALAQILVDSHNMAMKKMEENVQRQDEGTQKLLESQQQITLSTVKIEETVKKNEELQRQNLETARKALGMIEQLAQKQGTGEITLFFDTGSSQLSKGSPEVNRLVQFLDFVARESRGRKVLFVSVGSASARGDRKINQKLAQQRSEQPVSYIDKYLLNVPHEIYRVYGTGDLYSPKDVPAKEHLRYQNARIIAFFDTDKIPPLPVETERK